MIKYGDETNNFKFIVFDNNFNNPVIIEAAQSSGGQYSFVGLRNKILIIQDTSTTDLYGYEFNPGNTALTQI